ncbi:hypothetical protein [Streptosporangium sp. NPDC006007]|uniref:hypothetical protein n=1 Tax=Streptosporangium sp. NPDC006007 TaxID=3154575 RepID=UPI0033AA41BA
MRRIITVAVAVLGVATAACGAGTGTATGAGPGTAGETPRAVEQVYVINLHGAEDGRADQRPENLVVSEFSSLRKVGWRSWGPDGAVGTGRLSGTWCLPTCRKTPYTATVTLGGVKKVRGKNYFTTFSIDGDFTKPRETADTLTGNLPMP